MKEPHTALFVAPTGVGKTHLALSLLETEYRYHFDFIVIICPTLRYNSTYKNRSWIWNDPDVIPIEPGNQLYYLIEKISNLLAGDKALFLIDDIIANETLDKRCQPLLELAILGRHIHEENDIIGLEKLARVKAQLKQEKHTCLIMRMEHPRAYVIC